VQTIVVHKFTCCQGKQVDITLQPVIPKEGGNAQAQSRHQYSKQDG
jgi:hypothetical protein